METISREYVTDVYDELVNSLRAHSILARQNVKIGSVLKAEKSYAIANKIIEGSNADKRDAAYQEHYRGHLILFEILEDAESDAKLRLEIARIKVEELRLYIRIVEGERHVTQNFHVTNTPYESPTDEAILRDLGLD